MVKEVAGEGGEAEEQPFPINGAPLVLHYGVDSLRYYGIHMLSGDTVLLATGNFVLFADVEKGDVVDSLSGPPNGGIGAVAVHPQQSAFVVCEKHPHRPPRIVDYGWPSREERRVLMGGGARGFSACAFSSSGDLLATVSMRPDFVLTVWNWADGTIVLRNKAFSAAVYSVRFSPFDSGRLVTGGATHVKFWEMANTFTGLKLQGAIGKFGKLDLCDVTAFAILPDGKVISGSECGVLILWEGNLVKCAFVRSQPNDASRSSSLLKRGRSNSSARSSLGGKALLRQKRETFFRDAEPRVEHEDAIGMVTSSLPAHAGRIDVVELIEKERILMTAGCDGFIRYWDAHEMDIAEATDTTLQYAPRCLKEVFLGEGVLPRALTLDAVNKRWIILDAAGAIRQLPVLSFAEIMGSDTVDSPPGTSVQSLTSVASTSYRQPARISHIVPASLTFNGGHYLCAAASPIDHTIVTGGADGSLRLIDYLHRRECFHVLFKSPVVSVHYLRKRRDLDGHLLLVACADGSVRLVARGTDRFAVFGTWRPHREPPAAIAVDAKENMACAISVSGSAFFFEVRWGGDSDSETGRQQEPPTCLAAPGENPSWAWDIHPAAPVRLFPLGFCSLPLTNPRCAEWDWDSSACLVGFESGAVLAIQPPKDGEVKPEKTFKFPCSYAAVGLRPRPRPDEVGAGERPNANGASSIGASGAAETEGCLTDGRPSAPIALGRVRRSRSGVTDDVTSEDTDEEEEEEDVGPFPVQFIRRVAGSVACRAGGSVGAAIGSSSPLQPMRGTQSFVIGYDRPALTQVYSCAIRYPGQIDPPPIPPTGIDPVGRVEGPIATVCTVDHCGVPLRAALSVSGEELLVAYEGSIVVRSRVDMLGKDARVAASMHDGVDGQVTAMDTSYDGTMLLTVGDDGLLVVQENNPAAPGPVSAASSSALPLAPPAVAALLRHSDPHGSTVDVRGPFSCHGAPNSSNSSIISVGPALRGALDSTAHATITVVSEPRRPKSPSAVMAPDATAALTIQEQNEAEKNRLKAEEAEQRLQTLQNRIDKVMKEYATALELNAQLPADQQLTEELSLGLEDELAKEKANRVEAARKHFAWDLAKSETLVHKVQQRFLSNLISDRFVVNSFDGTLAVASFRTRALTEAQQAHQAELQRAQQQLAQTMAPQLLCSSPAGKGPSDPEVTHEKDVPDSVGRDSEASSDEQPVSAPNASGTESSGVEKGSSTHPTRLPKIVTVGSGAGSPHTTLVKSHLDKADERREEREQRRRGYEELLARRSTGEEDDAECAKAIAYLEAHRGDYKLKSDPSYRTPLSERPTSEKKVQALLQLEADTIRLRSDFNEKLRVLRSRKARLLQEVNQLRQRRKEINSELGGESVGGLEPVVLTVEELAESRFDLTREQLDAFEAEQKRKQQAEEALQKAQRGFGGDLGVASSEPSSSVDVTAEHPRRKSVSRDWDSFSKSQHRAPKNRPFSERGMHEGERRSTPSVSRPSVLRPLMMRDAIAKQSIFGVAALSHGQARDRADGDGRGKPEGVKPSDMELEELAMRREVLQFESKQLEGKEMALRAAFDEELFALQVERTRLDSALCLAELRMLLLFREYELLLEFKKRDVANEEQLVALQAKRAAVEKRIESFRRRLQRHSHNVERLAAKEKVAQVEGERYVYDTFRAEGHAYLLRVFRRHVKRKLAADNLDDDDDVTSDDDDEVDGNGDDDDGPFEEEKPADCTAEEWEELLSLRRHRLDISDALADKKRAAQQMQKELQELERQRVTLERAITACREDVDKLHMDKQRALHELETIVVLTPAQVQCLRANGELPEDIQSDELVLFTYEGFATLRQRLTELAEEKIRQRGEIAALAQRAKRLHLKRSKKQAEHEEWEQRVFDIMLLKFGRRVDLEQLENVGVSREVDELRAQVRSEELRLEREIRMKDAEIERLKQELMEAVAENTVSLRKIGDTKHDQRNLERQLNKSGKQVLHRLYGTSRVATDGDRANLRDLIGAQQEEIDALAAEIAMLRRKGGHAYSNTA